MNADSPTILGLVSVIVLCIVAVGIGMFGDGMFYSKDTTVMKSNISTQLENINRIAISHYNNNNEEKVNEQRELIKERLQKIASDSFEAHITQVNLEGNYFPFLPAAELKPVDPESAKPMCDFASSIPIHFQKIPDAEMFQLFMGKYSEFSIEIDVQDERRYGSDVHYGIRAISDDGNHSAGTFIHVNSCDNEILSHHFLSCYDKTKDELMMANSKEMVTSSLEHDEFCILPLDVWHQQVYDYGKILSEQTRKHFAKADTMNKDYETVMKFQNELERLGALSDIQNSMFQDESLDIVLEKIQKYNVEYGNLPLELQELLDAKSPPSLESNKEEKEDSQTLYDINHLGLEYQKNNDSEKLNEQMLLMQEKQKEIASDILGVTISNVYIDKDWNFPFRNASDIEPFPNAEQTFPICDIPKNTPIHLEKIRNSEMFSMFSEKYSQNHLEFEISDERNYNSIIHYSISATSEDQKRIAGVFFHVDSCTGKISVPYNLDCRDKSQEGFGNNQLQTRFKDEIQSSLDNEEFCVIELEPWHQKMREYHVDIGEQLKQITINFEESGRNEDINEEGIFQFHLEFQRLGLLNDLVRSATSGTIEDKDTHELIAEYIEKYDDLPDELALLLEMKEQHFDKKQNYP